jgi:hypothetical protein
LGRELKVFEGDFETLREALIANGAPGKYAPAMARYFAKVAKGLYQPTDTAAKVLDRKPRSYAQWLERNLSDIRSRYITGSTNKVNGRMSQR